jgi:phage-related tail fiber protein
LGKYPAIHNGTSFVNLLNRSQHTGTQPWSTIADTPTTLAGYGITDAVPNSHAGAGGAAHAVAVPNGAAGFMSGLDKAKLDTVSAGATVNAADAYLLDRTNHTGTQVASTISNFDTQVRSNRLDQLAVPTTALNLNSQRITNLGDGVQAGDAATWGQLQSIANGTDWKASVRALSDSNVVLSGLPVIDGVSIAAGDRVALIGQSLPELNGVYVASSGSWARAVDTDGAVEVSPGMAFFVEEGSSYADTQWRLTTNGPIVLGTTHLAFGQIGAATTFLAGAGLLLSGNVFSADFSQITRKFSQAIGDGTSTSITVNHNLANLDVLVQVFESSSGATVECDVARSSSNQVTLAFVLAPTAGAYRVVILG